MWKALLAPRPDRPDRQPRTPPPPVLVIAHLPGLLALGAGLAAAVVGQPLGGPWLWAPALVVGLALAWFSVGLVVRAGGALRRDRNDLARRLTDTELHRKQFVAELLVNLARRSQGTVYRQLEILGRLQEGERDQQTLAELFRLDHLATRVQRTANNLLVLAGEQAPRPGGTGAPLREVVRSAVTGTEDVERVLFIVDDQQRVAGHAVADLAHLLSELVENAVRFSPPDSVVSVRSARTDQPDRGRLLTVEDWGVGFPADAVAEANALMAQPHEVDLSVSQRLGLHVVARLAQRHGIRVVIGPGASCGTVCTLTLPAALFEAGGPEVEQDTAGPAGMDGETAALPLTPPAGDPAATQRIPALSRSAAGSAATAGASTGTHTSGEDASTPAASTADPSPGGGPLLHTPPADPARASGATRTATTEPTHAGPTHTPSTEPAHASPTHTPTTEPAHAAGPTHTSNADPAPGSDRPDTEAGPATAIRVPVARAGDGPTPRRTHAGVDLFDPAPGRIPYQPGAPDAGSAPDDPTPTPTRGTPLPRRRRSATGSLPGPFGSTGRWEGWWESTEDPPSPVAATAPASTGPWPVAGPHADTPRGPARPRPPVAAPPGRARTATGAPIAWVDPNPAAAAPPAPRSAPVRPAPAGSPGTSAPAASAGSTGAPAAVRPAGSPTAASWDFTPQTGSPTSLRTAAPWDAAALTGSPTATPASGSPTSEPWEPAPLTGAPTSGSPTAAPRTSPAATATTSAPGSAPTSSAPPADPEPGGLHRRVPQANLAPELRDPAPEPAAARDTASTPAAHGAAALSRYQASREAARIAMAEDAAAALDRPPAPAADRREDDRSPADRYKSGPSGKSLARTDHHRPRTADEAVVPDDAGDDRSTGHDAVPADPGAPAPPAADRSAPGPAAAASGPTGTGDNRGMDRDAGEPSQDHPTPEHPHEHGAGGER